MARSIPLEKMARSIPLEKVDADSVKKRVDYAQVSLADPSSVFCLSGEPQMLNSRTHSHVRSRHGALLTGKFMSECQGPLLAMIANYGIPRGQLPDLLPQQVCRSRGAWSADYNFATSNFGIASPPTNNHTLSVEISSLQERLSRTPSAPAMKYQRCIKCGTVKALTADGNGRQSTSKPGEMIVCFGEMLIDFVPTSGGISLAQAPAFKKAPGGAPANVAVGIARLGGTSAFMGKVGDDEFGYMLVDILKENRVESRGVRFDPGARTALAFVTLREDGEREFMFYRNPSADMLLETSELDLELLQSASIFHYGSISLISEPCRSAHLAAMDVARKAGVLLSYDPNLRLPLWPSADAARKGIKAYGMKLISLSVGILMKVSEEEIAFLTEGGDPYSDEAALKLWHPNLRLFLVTEGEAGCRYYTKNFFGRVGGLKVTPVDTTGAGDAFVAGLLAQLVRDMSLLEDEPKLREALKFANACGAITTTERGAIPALPDRDTVLRLISKLKVGTT